LEHCNTHQRQLKTFLDFFKHRLQTQHGRDFIKNIAITRHEDPDDVNNDIIELHSTTGIAILKIFLSALIYSQLFQVPKIRLRPHLYSLNEFSKLSKHHQSFVCYHDQGNIKHFILI
jgi:hypothetical protein